MSEQLKFIIDSLNKPPFNRNYNLISFDALQSSQLLQVMNDVFSEISPQQASDVRDEDPEMRILRMLAFLKSMKYKPPKTDADGISEFRAGLVNGDKPVIYSILVYLLERVDDLKKRAYLANFLTKLDVPADFLIEQEVNDSNTMYLDLLAQFKEVHKASTEIEQSGYNVGEIKKDILSMEEEQGQLKKRIERLQKRVDSTPNKAKLFEASQKLRTEREREAGLAEQRSTQKHSLTHAEQRIGRMNAQLKELQAAGIGITGEGLVKRLEEENQVNVYLTSEKLPQEMESKRKYVTTLQKVVDEPAMGQAELETLNRQIASMSAEINQLVEKRMVRNDPIDDKLSVFRQQASVIQNKKSSVAENFQEATDEMTSLDTEVTEKKERLNNTEGGEVLKGDEFKRYVNKLRGKNAAYKKLRTEYAEMQAEVGVLNRTVAILSSRADVTLKQLSSLEQRAGVTGFANTQEELEKVSTMKSEIDDQKGRILEDMSQMVVQLTNTIAEKKSDLAPIIKELRPMRQKCQELTVEHGEKKSTYESTAAGLESNMSRQEQEVKGFREEVTAEESRLHYIEAMIKILKVQQQQVEEEMKLYVSSDSAERKKSLRDKYTQNIHEQENLGKALREKQKYVRESHVPNMKQKNMWNDLTTILRCKQQAKGAGAGAVDDGAFEEQDHLVL